MPDFWSNIVSGFWGSIIGVMIGGFITYIVARSYYVKASKELSDAASELENLITVIGRGLENAGIFKFNRNEQGKIVGLKGVMISAQNIVIGSGVEGSLSLNSDES